MWDGFVLCCQKLKAKCAHILLSLPEHALLKIMQTAPDLNTYLATYLGQYILLLYFLIYIFQINWTKRKEVILTPTLLELFNNSFKRKLPFENLKDKNSD